MLNRVQMGLHRFQFVSEAVQKAFEDIDSTGGFPGFEAAQSRPVHTGKGRQGPL